MARGLVGRAAGVIYRDRDSYGPLIKSVLAKQDMMATEWRGMTHRPASGIDSMRFGLAPRYLDGGDVDANTLSERLWRDPKYKAVSREIGCVSWPVLGATSAP